VDEEQRHAPVEASSTVEVGASPGVVWNVLADIDGWPDWNPAIREVSVDGDIEVGTHFRWATGPGTVTSHLTLVEAPAAIAWSGSFMTIIHDQAWTVETAPTGSIVTVRTALSGPLARLFARRLAKGQQAALDAWAGLLRLEAEARRQG